jgi:hypothetical protein
MKSKNKKNKTEKTIEEIIRERTGADHLMILTSKNGLVSTYCDLEWNFKNAAFMCSMLQCVINALKSEFQKN